MFVKEIKEDCKQVLGICPDWTIYNRLTQAIEVLSNEGNWDSLQAYMDMTVTNRIITLPRDVETPVKVNINNNPSFTRSRLYEFSLNGPGNDMPGTKYSWMDRGEVVVFRNPNSSGVRADSDDPIDTGRLLNITGLDINDRIQVEAIAVNGPLSDHKYKSITRVGKEDTLKKVTLLDEDEIQLAIYYPVEPEPRYRQIILSEDAKAIRMQYRRKTYKITSDEEWIPLDSTMAILTMLKALEAIRNGSTEELQKVPTLKAEAIDFLKKEQISRNNFEIASQSELPPCRDLNYNNADSVIVADIYNDTCDIFGPIGQPRIFDKITDGVELLNNHAQWDGLVGYVDLITDNHRYITLPRYVESPVEINLNGTPAMMRNKWFEFHLNGPGSSSTACGYWDDIGDVATIRPLVAPVQLTARNDLLEDDGKTITVYGWDINGKWIETLQDAEWKDGLRVSMSQDGAKPDPDAKTVARIERIVKDKTTGFCQLVGYIPAQKATIPIGYYFPDETEPNYHRIKLPSACTWVRMRYRKRQLKVTSLTDPLHLKNKLAIVTALRSIKALESDASQAQALELKAIDYLVREQASRNPGETFSIQFSGIEPSEVII